MIELETLVLGRYLWNWSISELEQRHAKLRHEDKARAKLGQASTRLDTSKYEYARNRVCGMNRGVETECCQDLEGRTRSSERHLFQVPRCIGLSILLRRTQNTPIMEDEGNARCLTY